MKTKVKVRKFKTNIRAIKFEYSLGTRFVDSFFSILDWKYVVLYYE